MLASIPFAVPGVFICGFFAVLFLQSGVDKVIDFKGNLGWMTPHFAKSPFKRVVGPLLGLLTVLELVTGGWCLVAAIVEFREGGGILSYQAMLMVCLTLICLFAGQRLAKDYAGAATIATYFGVALIGLALVLRPMGYPFPN